MKIALIGYGSTARALSKRWATTHELSIGGRNIESTDNLAREICATESGSIADAVQFGDVIILATPANAVAYAIESAGGADAFSGKVVIDINNSVSVPSGPHENEGEHYLPLRFNEGLLSEHIGALSQSNKTPHFLARV